MEIEIIAALMDSGFCQQNIFIFGNEMLVARSFFSFSITIMLGLYHYYHVRPHIDFIGGTLPYNFPCQALTNELALIRTTIHVSSDGRFEKIFFLSMIKLLKWHFHAIFMSSMC